MTNAHPLTQTALTLPQEDQRTPVSLGRCVPAEVGDRRGAGLRSLAGGCCRSKEPFPIPAEGFHHPGACIIPARATPVGFPGCGTHSRSGGHGQPQEPPFAPCG